MITLKLAPYTDHEIQFLCDILVDIKTRCVKECGNNGECNECKIRHVCGDFYSALQYVIKIKKERK